MRKHIEQVFTQIEIDTVGFGEKRDYIDFHWMTLVPESFQQDHGKSEEVATRMADQMKLGYSEKYILMLTLDDLPTGWQVAYLGFDPASERLVNIQGF